MAGQVHPDFGGAYRGRKVLVTGHTGFKGGWLCLWLKALGAEVIGVALPPEDDPSLYAACKLADEVDDRFADINDPTALGLALGVLDADLVIHMAAQAIVRESYEAPADTFMTNVVGTAHVLDAARSMASLSGVLVVSSDKCYENNEWVWGYRENDPMGGSDPYSASKGCTELVTASYRRSFFNDPDGPALASARAGNVFGGGDWAKDRLVPDIVRAVAAGEAVELRNPESVRPWQHVLEPLSGYLALGQRLLERRDGTAEGWNFGPDNDGVVNVATVAEMISQGWEGSAQGIKVARKAADPEEAKILRLDSTKAATRLGWRPQLALSEAVDFTVDWYRRHAAGEDMRVVMREQIASYSERMAQGI